MTGRTIAGQPLVGEVVRPGYSGPRMVPAMEGRLDDVRAVVVDRAEGNEPIFDIRIAGEPARLRIDLTDGLEALMEAYAATVPVRG